MKMMEEAKMEKPNMKWKIVADSSCDLLKLENSIPGVGYSIVPFKIRVGEREFIDDSNLDVGEMMLAAHEHNEASSSACPSPGEWMEEFIKADQIIAITISSALSGSYNSAQTAKNMVLDRYPDKKIYIIDSLSAGPGLVLVVQKIQQLIGQGMDFESVVQGAQAYSDSTQVFFALSSFENLVKNGRMNRFMGFIAGKMSMWAIGCDSAEGKIEMLHKTRGQKRAATFIVKEMERRGFKGGPVAIDHCSNEELAQWLRELLKEKWENVNVMILPTRGVCSYYAEENGIIIGFSR